jgi:hypothetical protein
VRRSAGVGFGMVAQLYDKIHVDWKSIDLIYLSRTGLKSCEPIFLPEGIFPNSALHPPFHPMEGTARISVGNDLEMDCGMLQS